MALLELRETRRLGYGFGLRQSVLLVTLRRLGNSVQLLQEQAALLGARVRASLAESMPGAEQFGAGAPQVAELAAWALALQRRARIPVFEQPRIASQRDAGDGTIDTVLIIPFVDVEATRIALAAVIGLVNDFAEAASTGDSTAVLGGLAGRIDKVTTQLGPRAPSGVNSYRICQAAFDERIPFTLFFRDTVLLGEGVKLKRMLSTITDVASPIGVAIARNKMQTAMALRQAGFPTVRHYAASSEDQAVEYAGRTGFPTVVKPFDADGGAGVSAGLMTEQGVREAYREALKTSKNIIVEAFVHGNNYRVHVCNGRIVKTTLRRPGGVDGDGVTSIAGLLERLESDAQSQRRRRERGKALLSLDDEARQLLEEMGMTGESVPAQGQFVPLRRRSNVSTGGTTTDVKGTLHPDNVAMFVRAAQLLGLDFAGIDFISPDISKSWLEVDSAICEINAQPQLGNDLNPKLYNELLRDYVGGTGRIPWVLVLGGGDNKRETGNLAALIRRAVDRRLSPAVVVAPTGVWIGTERIAGGNGTLASECEHVVLGRFAAAVVVAGDPAQLVNHGIATSELDFIALCNDPHPSRAEWLGAIDMIAPHVRKAVIVEIGDPALPDVKARVPVSKLLLVTLGGPDEAVREHLAAGGHAAWLHSLPDSGDMRLMLGSKGRTVDLGKMTRSVQDRRRMRDLMIARVIEVQLPNPAQAAGQQKG